MQMYAVGTRVYDIILGKWGTIVAVRPEDFFPIKVNFDDGDSETYLTRGSYCHEVISPTLYFYEAKMPPIRRENV